LAIMGTGDSYSPLEHHRELLPRLREVGKFFQEGGIEPAIWLGHTVGHGSLFTGDTPTFTSMVECDGEGNLHEQPGVFCVLDEKFIAHTAKLCSILAESGLPMLMLDDDLRLSIHGLNYGCFCPLHMETFRKRSGLDLSDEELAKNIRTDLKLRRLWLENNGDSFYAFAEAIAKAVHAVNPEMRLGLCATPQLFFGDGADGDKLSNIFAGGTRPFIRLSGAPYWARPSEHAGEIIEFSRLQKSWIRNPETEIFVEGDTFPHNTYVTSANMLEAFTEGLAASGMDGILSYQYSYGDHQTTDMEYHDLSVKALPFRKALRQYSPKDWTEIGFEPGLSKDELKVRPSDPETWPLFRPPCYFCMMAPRLGIPTAYGNPDAPVALFGPEVEAFSDEELKNFLKRGAAVDAVAAEILIRRGFDLGIQSITPRVKSHTSDITDTGVSFLLRCFANNIFRTCIYRQDALVRLCSTFDDGEAGIAHLKNADGNKILFFPWDVAKARWTNFNAIRQQQWQEAYHFLTGNDLPLAVSGKADARLHLRMSPDGSTVAATIQNLSLDKMPLSRITIGKEWQLHQWLPTDAAAPVNITPEELGQ
ncbi:MAG: hypothetical protein J6S21_08175, partial [Victivallales bacterium]|nr:hypothetical protein [Victivallales bacterium]